MAIKTLRPIHPGEILSEEFMVPLALSANEIARSIGVTPARVAEIASERRGITADTALPFTLLQYDTRCLAKPANAL